MGIHIEPSPVRGRDARMRALWPVVRWPLFALAILAAGVFGYLGFDRYFDGLGQPRGVTDLLYLTIQLFVLESGSVPAGDSAWQFEVARVLAPATTGLAIVMALAAAFREELSEVRLRLRRRHIVVCGLGEKGSRLTSSLLAAGYKVVGVEKDTQAIDSSQARHLGALVVQGDARSPAVLRRARVPRAAYVVALTGADDANAEVAIQAGEMAPADGPALTCLAHVRDPGLCALLRSEELAAAHTVNYRLDFFNLHEQGARAMLRDHSPFRHSARPPAVAVIGLTPIGEAVVVEVARQWRVHTDAQRRRVRLMVFAPDAARSVDLLHARYPQLEHAAEVLPIEMNLEHLDSRVIIDQGPWDVVYVCVEDDSAALDVALQARRCLHGAPTDVVVELTRSAGLASLLDRPGGYDGVSAFDVLDRTLEPQLLLGGTYEMLARAIHTEYFAEQLRQGATAASNPSLVPWERLPESLKESNRDQAAHIGVKLATLSYGIAPLSDWSADEMEFDEAEVELLAKLEHERWVDQRLRDGWTPGPKDVDERLSPYLIPWSELSEEVKEWDRRAVRGIPAFLARTGYQVSPTAHRRMQTDAQQQAVSIG